MSKAWSRTLVGLVCVTQIVFATPSTWACTGIRIQPADGSVIAARTLEFGAELRSNVLFVPRGKPFVGTAPGNRPGLRWTARYAAVGVNAYDLPLLVDGLNEKGLGVGLFYFPGYAGYQQLGDAEASHAMAPHEVATFLLTECSDTVDALRALARVKVGAVELSAAGMVLPVHFVIHDQAGRCVVVEYVDGRLNQHENPLGVVTNAPTFDWHVTNLRNYVNLTVTAVPAVELSVLKLSPVGMGAGMLGLPGDFTPPSRFVRAVAFTRSAVPVETALQGVRQAFHILNQFDIPKGAAREGQGAQQTSDYTQWTTAADLKNMRYYFHTYENRKIRMVDLKAFDPATRDIVTIPMAVPEVIEDVTPRSR